MTATIKLLVRSGSGVLSKVASELQTQGIRVKSHDLEPVNESSVMLTLNAESRDPLDEASLKSLLAGVDVIQNVENISQATDAAGPSAPVVEVPESVVDRVVSAFPKIMPQIQSYEETLATDPQKFDKLRQLGIETGRRLAGDTGDAVPESLAQLIDEVVLPGIRQVAEVSREGETVVASISLFTRRLVTSMDLMGGDDEQCYFLCGLIEGLAATVPGYEAVSVVESKCRANGDTACVFQLN